MAVIFDLDGVISNTASLHEKAWKMVFDEVLELSGQADNKFQHEEYTHYLDGKTRIQGIESFLASRKLNFDRGEIDSQNLHHINGIGNRKNTLFVDLLSNNEIVFFEDALLLLEKLKLRGIQMAIGSSSKNAKAILKRGDLEHYFDIIIDGIVASCNNVKSKPDPAFYAYVAQSLNQKPRKCVVIEDAISGIISAKKAGIGNVIAIDRLDNEENLYLAGADIVVNKLTALTANDLMYHH